MQIKENTNEQKNSVCKESKQKRGGMHNGYLCHKHILHIGWGIFFDLHIADWINSTFFIFFFVCLFVCLSDFSVCMFFRVLFVIISPRSIVLMFFKVNILLHSLKTCNISSNIVISGDQMLPLRTQLGFLLSFATNGRRINNNIDKTAT